MAGLRNCMSPHGRDGCWVMASTRAEAAWHRGAISLTFSLPPLLLPRIVAVPSVSTVIALIAGAADCLHRDCFIPSSESFSLLSNA
ncbi:hypothetical protein SDJN02_08167, partial [Cucurbita argyrosperma subsp. argyrosperma]